MAYLFENSADVIIVIIPPITSTSNFALGSRRNTHEHNDIIVLADDRYGFFLCFGTNNNFSTAHEKREREREIELK